MTFLRKDQIARLIRLPASPWRARSPYARAKPSDAAFPANRGYRGGGRGAHETAFNYFESALSHADENEPRERVELLYRLAIADRGLGRWTDANKNWTRTLNIFCELNDSEWIARIAFRIASGSGGYGEQMEDIDVKKLSVDFSQDRDLEAIEAKVLAFLRDDVAESGTVTCVIREAGEVGDNVQRVYRLGLGQAEAEVVETSAGEIASYLAEYAKGKDGKLYSDATLEIHHP